MKRLSIIAAIALLPVTLLAQHFSNKAKVDAVSQRAFYKIRLHSGIIGYSNDDLGDLRLFDNDGKEVPYLLNKEKLDEQVSNFVSYPFELQKDGNKDVIIIENSKKNTISEFLFEMKNAVASRLVRISGSDNKDNWFVVRDSFYFDTYNNNTSDVETTLQFPKTDYAFYKVEISNGANEAPLNIIRIGRNNTAAVAALFQPVNGLEYKVKDSAKSTFIRFKLKPGNKIDQLSFTIDAPEMFRRKITITRWVSYGYNTAYGTSESVSRHTEPTSMDAELSSAGANNIVCASLLGNAKADSFSIQIFNQDDAPLHIREIKAYQLATTITAKLEKDKNYFLYFGDTLLQAPAYDLVYFEKNISSGITSINAQQVQPKAQQDKDEYNGNRDKWIVWIGLGLAGITILLLTMNMMKKMKQPEQ